MKDLARSGKGLAYNKHDRLVMAIVDAAENRDGFRIDDCVIAASAAKATPLWREHAPLRVRAD